MIPWLTPSMIASRASGILTFMQRLQSRRTERVGGLDRMRRHVAHTRIDETDHDGGGVQHGREDTRHDRDGHQIDERDDVHELRQRLQHVEHGSHRLADADRSQPPRHRAGSR